MRVLSLRAEGFRNIKKAVLLPCEEMNVICGENAQGKTNLLEAVWLFTGAKSFRSSKDSELVCIGKEKAALEMSFIAEQAEKEATVEIRERRTATLNRTGLKLASQLAGSFNSVIFSPTDLKLVTEGPAVRRRFTDTALGQLYPSYIGILKNYTRAVSQRNKVIKDYKYDSTLSIMLDAFEEEIAENGKKIILLRKKYLNLLNEFLPAVYSGLSNGREMLETLYICNCNENELASRLRESRREDMYSGITSSGPHRDDIKFKINGIDVRSFGSQGQKRSVALSLKLAEAQVMERKTGEAPIFLLDDVMSELDPSRQNFVLNHIKGMQTFLTCCDPSNINNLKAGKIFNVREGEIV